MNISNIKIASINRLIAHEVHAKTEKKDAFAVSSKSLLNFEKAERQILIERIGEALTNTTKTFQLDYEDKSPDSVYSLLEKIKTLNETEFIKKSISLADDLAFAHFRTKIPGGYCLIGNGLTSDDRYFFFVIKAELQSAFNIKGNKLSVIKDVFLSPAKDFYKVGFFIEHGKKFIPFMYDDQFSLQKKDLTEYFYGTFLGLTTDKNDRLKAKNFYDDTKNFIEANVDNIQDRIGMVRALNVLYREDTSGLISATDFADKYFEGELKAKFHKKIVDDRYPISFTKDVSLLENKLELQRITIPLTYNVSIVGNSAELVGLDIIDEPSKESLRKLEPEINNGRIKKLVVLKQTN